jgi:galactokinase
VVLDTDTAARSFRETYGSEPQVFSQAPGRANLIGEHIDYADGWVLPIALTRGVTVAAARAEAGHIRVHSDQYLDAGVAEYHPGRQPPTAFVSFVYALALDSEVAGADLAVVSDLPVERGWSSSAAFSVAVFTALLALTDGLRRPAAIDFCRVCQRAETKALGLECGLMDQCAAVFGRADHAVWYDTYKQTHEYVPCRLPGSALMLIDSGQPRNLAQTGYNQRRRELSVALQQLKRRTGDFASLRELETEKTLNALRELPELSRQRLRHVITEQQRVSRFVAALKAGDVIQLGRLLAASHHSLSEDYDVSTPELDMLCDLLTTTAGIYGARLMGGGFGGAVLALLSEQAVSEDLPDVLNTYTARTQLETECLEADAGDGARVFLPDQPPQLVRDWLP